MASFRVGWVVMPEKKETQFNMVLWGEKWDQLVDMLTLSIWR